MLAFNNWEEASSIINFGIFDISYLIPFVNTYNYIAYFCMQFFAQCVNWKYASFCVVQSAVKCLQFSFKTRLPEWHTTFHTLNDHNKHMYTVSSITRRKLFHLAMETPACNGFVAIWFTQQLFFGHRLAIITQPHTLYQPKLDNTQCNTRAM